VSDEVETAEVMEYATTSPELLKAMLVATEILEKLMRGEITFSEAIAIYEKEVASVIEKIREQSKPAKSKKSESKKKSSKKKSKKKG